MTNFGKTLILINLGVSLLMATFALGIYTNTIPYHDITKDNPGEVTKKKAEVERLWQSVRPAEEVWREARAYLFEQEAHRAADRVWYQDELQHLLIGDMANSPSRMIEYKAGRPEPADPKNPFGRPKMVPAKDREGNPLLSLRAYNQEEETTLMELKRVTENYDALVKQTTAETEKLLGPKGLHARIKAEKEKRDEVVKEQGLVRPQLVNTVVDSELILKRQKELVARIKELESIGVAGRQP
jgi:hypothetical protein